MTDAARRPDVQAVARPPAAASNPEEDRLARALVAGDPAALDEVVQRYAPQIARQVHRLLAWPEDVADVVQEVFVTALAKRSQFRSESRLATWLTAIAVNHCRRHRRTQWFRLRRLHRVRSEVESSGGAEAERADAAVVRTEQGQAVQAAVARLPHRYREVIVLHYLEELPIEEVSRLLGLSRGAVDTRLSRARKKLKTELGDVEL
ncbi:MAG: sigma-70 family RNA polymerase sigma factor [Pirellulales bacterium]